MAPGESVVKFMRRLEFGSSGSCIETWGSFQILASSQNLLIETWLGNVSLNRPAALSASIG